MEDTEETYTVWTGTLSYSTYEGLYGAIDDNKYYYGEYSTSGWKNDSSWRSDDNKHTWTKDKIYDWFIGRGLSKSQATQMASWATTIEHGWVDIRSGSKVYVFQK